MLISNEFIESGKSARGGWKREQLMILGEGWPPRDGWKRRAIGKLISDDLAARFVELRGK